MLLRVLAVAAAVTALTPLIVAAGSIYQSKGPAELPPASFKGNQFVDSSGCIFMRAGYGNQTSWVPRVTRDRRVMCGFKPTFAASQTRAVKGGGITTAITLAKPKPMPLKDVPAPTAVQVASAAKTTPEATGKSTGKATGKMGLPMATIAGSVGPAAAAGSGKISSARTTPGIGAKTASPAPIRVVTASGAGNVPVAPPQPMSPRKAKAGGAQPGGRHLTLGAAPKQKVYTSQTAANGLLPNRPQTGRPVAPPPGYKIAWTDGRLNPLRGPRTEAGNQQMNLVWTQTVPRRLINTTTMRDVTAHYPQLQSPHTAQPPQPSGASPAVPRGYRPVRPLRVAQAKTARVTLSTSNGAGATAMVAAPRRARVAASQAAAGRGARQYVQVGLFGVPSNATRTVARLQSVGLPVRVATIRSRGRVLRSVMAGPFASPNQLSAALATARRAGFGDAYIR